MPVLDALARALFLAFFMFWEVLWPLALGFLLSAIVQTVVSKHAVARVLGPDTPRSVGLATLFGAASSSCSYAAVAVARSLFLKGATLANVIIFEFASTNLVFELGLVMLVLLGWQFVAAEFAGGLLMIVLLAVLFRLTLNRSLAHEARCQAQLGRVGRMEGHGAMDMSIAEGPFLRRLVSSRAFTAISHYFWMDVYSLWTDLLLGFLIAGALGAWVPTAVWTGLFLTGHPLAAEVWGPLIGPLLSLVSFVCSVGNVPLAAVLWNGGISFGGVIAFIFADLIIIPILDIYRKYYGGKVTIYLIVVSYLAMALSGFVVALAFGAVGLTPAHQPVAVIEAHPTWNYTSFLDLAFLALMAVLGWRFLTTGGPRMLRMMEAAPSRTEEMATDVVCGMPVNPETATETVVYQGEPYSFCTSHCRAAFEENPERYLHETPAGHDHGSAA